MPDSKPNPFTHYKRRGTSELVSNPLEEVRRIYRQFNLALSDVAAQRMTRLASTRCRYRPHRAARPFAGPGLDPAAEGKRFERYCSHFGISCKPVSLR